jgi:hypothetical protein
LVRTDSEKRWGVVGDVFALLRVTSEYVARFCSRTVKV